MSRDDDLRDAMVFHSPDSIDEALRSSRREGGRGDTSKLQIAPKAFIAQLKKILPSVPMSSSEVLELRSILDLRLRHKTCYKCGKNKVEMDGELIFSDGDMSKPKRWVCGDCK